MNNEKGEEGGGNRKVIPLKVHVVKPSNLVERTNTSLQGCLLSKIPEDLNFIKSLKNRTFLKTSL